MFNKIVAGLAVSSALVFGTPAFAGDWTETVDLCAAAAEAEGAVTANEYRSKFLYGSGASTKKVAIEMTSANGDVVKAECKIRRGKVTSIDIKA
ncbi:hypothetical protein [Hyphococcus lacteus]|uniref:Uncharacterized protein n=1 Tax=Hyphococcus lacteus TaxID=3143536 RepID=A0ABV3Z001_9PROT